MKLEKYEQSKYKGKIRELVQFADNARFNEEEPIDITFKEIVQEKYNITPGELLRDLGINPDYDTIKNIVVTADVDVRWIIPEIFRNALRLGYRRAPIWNNVIAAEEQMRGLRQVMPHWNMSDAAPREVGEGETIPLGDISYGSKQFSINKIGRGIKITDEVVTYSSVNLVSVFLEDFGVKLGHAIDVLAIDALINGEQADGSESAPVVGVASAGTKAYSDLLKIWIRFSRMGRIPGIIIGGEDAALDTLDLPEFKQKTVHIVTDTNGISAVAPGAPQVRMNFQTPLPQSADYYIHGNVPDNQEIIIDKDAALIKFNGFPLKVESERIVSNQTEAFYTSLQTGFAKMFRDGSLIVDSSIAFASNGFPTYMDVDAAQNVVIE